MSIYRTSALVAGLLIITGVVAYVVTGMDSFTALIPAFLGLVIGLSVALVRARPGLAKAVMHVVVLVALLGAIGSLVRVVPALTAGEITLPIAFAAQVATVLLCGYLVYASVQHFRANRRARAVEAG